MISVEKIGGTSMSAFEDVLKNIVLHEPNRIYGRVLMLRRSPARGGFWQPVTGRIEPGEEAGAAARRELREETGADVEVLPLGYRHGFGLDPTLVPPKRPGLRVCDETAFWARLPAGFVPCLSDEHDSLEWCTPVEAMRRPRYVGLRRAIGLAASCATMPNLS